MDEGSSSSKLELPSLCILLFALFLFFAFFQIPEGGHQGGDKAEDGADDERPRNPIHAEDDGKNACDNRGKRHDDRNRADPSFFDISSFFFFMGFKKSTRA